MHCNEPKPHSYKHIKYQLLQQVMRMTWFTPPHQKAFAIQPNNWIPTNITASALKLLHGVLEQTTCTLPATELSCTNLCSQIPPLSTTKQCSIMGSTTEALQLSLQN